MVTALTPHRDRTAAGRPAEPDDLHECDTIVTGGDGGPDARRVFQCAGCQWQIECLAAESDRATATGCPRCEGSLIPVPDVAALPNASHLPAESGHPPTRNKRLLRRRLPRAGVRAEVRRGASGLGPDVGLGLIDLSEDGVGLRLRSATRQGDEIEIVLLRTWGGKALKMMGEVRWCRPDRDGTFLSGVRLRRRLCRKEFLDLVR